MANHKPTYTEGICGDGAAILKDGVMMPIEDVVAELNRAALAQQQPAPPAEGKIGGYADFAAWLAQEMPAGTVIGDPFWWAPRIAKRAAALLQQRCSQPVPVSERSPDPRPESEGGDCDAEGRCWLCGKVEGDWRLLNPLNTGVPRLKYCFSH